MKSTLIFFFLLLFGTNGFAVDFTIAWDPNSESYLAGYNVYAKEEGSAADFSFVKTIHLWEIDENHPTYRLENFKADTRYHFYLTAFDDQGNESAASNIVCGLDGKPCPEEEDPPQTADSGYMVQSELWLKAVLDVSNNPIALVWREIGSAVFPNGDKLVSGYFYADPADFAYGSLYNPELFVKIYIATNGWCNIAFNHVTVEDISVYSMSGEESQSSTATLDARLVEHQYNGVSIDSSLQATGETAAASTSEGYTLSSGLWARAVLQPSTGAVNLIWKEVGTGTTPSGDTVVSGYFYASPPRRLAVAALQRRRAGGAGMTAERAGTDRRSRAPLVPGDGVFKEPLMAGDHQGTAGAR